MGNLRKVETLRINLSVVPLVVGAGVGQSGARADQRHKQAALSLQNHASVSERFGHRSLGDERVDLRLELRPRHVYSVISTSGWTNERIRAKGHSQG
jgi:hypothetical protein